MKIIIIGAGEVGFHIASRLAFENKDVVVVDKNAAAVRRITDSIDVQVVVGSGSSPVVLEEAGLKEAEILLAVTDSDEDNLVACLIADIMSPATRKLARVRNADYDQYHEVFSEKAPHIDTIINPEIEVVKTIYSLMKAPGASDVGELAGGRVKFIGVRLDGSSRLAGVKLSHLPEILGNTRPLIAGLSREDQLIVPRGSDRMQAGDLVYFICEKRKLSQSLEIFEKPQAKLKRVMIVGGGRIGLRLAEFLEEKSIYTKIIEINPERCQELSESMNKTIILHGDGSDQGLLLEENIRDMDVVVTLTGDEEINILVSLLAKSLGAKNAITKINKFSYFPVLSTIGIDQVVSPRLSAIDTILQHIRRGKVLSAMSVSGELAEVIEAEALDTSDIVGKPLRKISFPKGALVIAIVHDEEIIIPTGDDVIEPNDRVIIFATREAVPKMEKMLTVKLEFF